MTVVCIFCKNETNAKQAKLCSQGWSCACCQYAGKYDRDRFLARLKAGTRAKRAQRRAASIYFQQGVSR